MNKIQSLSELKFPNKDQVQYDLLTGFVVCVYNKRVSILVNRVKNNESAAFFELNYASTNFNTMSKDIETVISRSVADRSVELYYFDSLAVFAKTVLEKGWKIYSEIC